MGDGLARDRAISRAEAYLDDALWTLIVVLDGDSSKDIYRDPQSADLYELTDALRLQHDRDQRLINQGRVDGPRIYKGDTWTATS